MNIVIFSGYFHPHIGGLEVSVENLANYLSGKGDNVTMAEFPYWDIGGVFPLPKPWSLCRLLGYKCDIVVTNTRFFVSSLIGLLYAIANDKPVVHIEHGSCHPVMKNKFTSIMAKIYDHTFGYLVIHSADAVICQSEKAKDFVKHLGGRNITVTPLTGVDTCAFKAGEYNRNGKLVVMGIGRPIFAKGFQDVKEVFVEVKEYIPNAELVLVNDLPHYYIPDALKKADILVHPSYSEGGIAYPILEAGAMGIPAVVSDAGGTREVLKDGETAVIFPVGDKVSLKRGIIRLLEDPVLRRRIGYNMNRLVTSNYSLEKVCGAIESVIKGDYK